MIPKEYVQARLREFSDAEKQGLLLVPGFDQRVEELGWDQGLYLLWLLQEFEAGRTPDVQGNLSYVFLVVYDVIWEFRHSRDYEALASVFEFLREGYGATKVGRYLDLWQSDAALLVGDWDAAWEHRRRGRFYSLRIDDVVYIRSKCRSTLLEAQDLESLLGQNNGLTEVGAARLERINAEVDRILTFSHEAEGENIVSAFCARYKGKALSKSVFELMANECDYLISVEDLMGVSREPPANEEGLFYWTRSPQEIGRGAQVLSIGATGAVSGQLKVPFDRVPHALSAGALARCRAVMRQAENAVRRSSGLPEIGMGWVSEAALYKVIADSFPSTAVVPHGRPKWLGRQHLDIYMPEFNIGIEFQGVQHFKPIDFFGGKKAFERLSALDARKKMLCEKNGCLLIYVTELDDHSAIVDRIREARRSRS